VRIMILSLICALTTQVRPVGATEAGSEGFIDAGNGVRLFYRIAGSGRDTIVVLHGGPGFSMSYLAADLEPLTARHVLLFYDQRGTGKSTLVTDSAALDGRNFANDLETIRVYFKLDRVTLFAHSWGAGVAALYATRYPQRIKRLVIVDGISVRRMYHLRGIQAFDERRDSVTRHRLQELSAARLAKPGDAEACRAYFDLYFRATFADTAALRRSRGDFCSGTPEALANKISSVDRYTLRSLGEWDWRPALGRVTAPTLIIRGVFDHVPLESSREWALAVQNGRFLSFERSGHFPYLEVPEALFSAVEEFLKGRWPAGAEIVPHS